MTPALLALLLNLPPAWEDRSEPFEERAVRMHEIATAIDAAVRVVPWPDADEQAALLAAIAWHETKLSARLHRGDCRLEIGECDAYRWQGELRAGSVSLWQVQAPGLAGRANTRRAAVEAARRLARARAHCGTLEGAIALYATGSRCAWRRAAERARMARRLADWLRGKDDAG